MLFPAVLVCGLVVPAYGEGDDFAVTEMGQRRQLADHTRLLLLGRKFDRLEKLADEFRTKKSRFPSGLWKLNNYYKSLASPGSRATGDQWQRHLDLLEQWRTQLPQSITVHTALAAAHVKSARHARGSGYAHRVTEEGWRLFNERLQKAQGYRDQSFFEAYDFRWALVREGFRDLEKRYPKSLWNLNQFCQLACHAKDADIARELFQRIGERWDGNVWRNEGAYREWKKWATEPGVPPARDTSPEDSSPLDIE